MQNAWRRFLYKLYYILVTMIAFVLQFLIFKIILDIIKMKILQEQIGREL